jgi:hypothetical protein
MFLYFTFINGKIILSASADRITYKNQGTGSRVCESAIYPSVYENLYISKYHNKLIQLLKRLKIWNGVLLVSAFVENDCMYFYDPGFRLQGEAPDIHLKEVLDFDQCEMLINIAINKKVEISTCNTTLSNGGIKTATVWILCGTGLIGRIDGLDNLLNNFGVYKICQRLYEGDNVSKEMIGTEAQVLARIYLKEVLGENILDNINKIKDIVKVYNSNGINMKVHVIK